METDTLDATVTRRNRKKDAADFGVEKYRLVSKTNAGNLSMNDGEAAAGGGGRTGVLTPCSLVGNTEKQYGAHDTNRGGPFMLTSVYAHFGIFVSCFLINTNTSIFKTRYSTDAMTQKRKRTCRKGRGYPKDAVQPCSQPPRVSTRRQQRRPANNLEAPRPALLQWYYCRPKGVSQLYVTTTATCTVTLHSPILGDPVGRDGDKHVSHLLGL